jgi:uncharacterized protein YqeY
MEAVMSKIDEIRSEMIAAMKAGNKERKDTLSVLLSSLKNKAIDKRSDLTEEEENEVILKGNKADKRNLGFDSCRPNRYHRRM